MKFLEIMKNIVVYQYCSQKSQSTDKAAKNISMLRGL